MSLCSLKCSTKGLDEETWAASLLHNMGFSCIHKNVEEYLSECCIISFETVVET